MDARYRRSEEIDGGPLKSLVAVEMGKVSARDATASAIKTFRKREDEIGESIHRTNYQNLVLKNAAQAYREHPTDVEGYRKSLRDSLKDYPIPAARRHEYAAIVSNGEARYFLPIVGGKMDILKDEENRSLLDLSEAYCQDFLGTVKGTVPPSADGELGEELAGDEYVKAVSLAVAAGENGDPQAVEKVNDYAMGVLETHAIREMENMEDPVAAVEKYGGEAMEVGIPTSSGRVVVSSSSLPAAHRAQLLDNLRENAITILRNRKNKEHLASGLMLMEFPATYRGTSEDKKSLDMFGSIQLTLHPLTPDTVSGHYNNMMMFAKTFRYVPDGYVEEISARVNGMKDGYGAALWSTILHGAIEGGGESIATQFSKNTILRAYLLHDLTQNQGMEAGEALRVVNGIQRDAKNWDHIKEVNDDIIRKGKSATSRAGIYGTAVTPEKYGERGVEEYDGLFRTLYLTNGFNASNAQKVAKKCLDATYGTTRLGYYGKGWWNKRKVKYPPEAYYPSSVVGNVIVPELEDSVIPSLRKNLGYPDLSRDNYALVADDRTEQSFYNKGEGSPSPSWQVWYMNPQGALLPVFDGNGEVVRYSVDHAAVRENIKKNAILSRAMRISRNDMDDSLEEDVWQAAGEEIRQLEREGE